MVLQVPLDRGREAFQILKLGEAIPQALRVHVQVRVHEDVPKAGCIPQMLCQFRIDDTECREHLECRSVVARGLCRVLGHNVDRDVESCLDADLKITLRQRLEVRVIEESVVPL